MERPQQPGGRHDRQDDHDGGRADLRQSEFADGRRARAGAHAGLAARREAGAPEPRAHPRARRARQGLGRAWHADHHPRHHAIHQGKRLRAGRQEDRDDGPLLDRGGRDRRGRCRARRARLCAEVLYRRGQLGPRRQQHARLLRARPAEVPRFHPHAEAAPEDQSAFADGDVGFLVAFAREPASGHDPLFRSRAAADRAPHERLWLAHLFLHQRRRRALLGQVPLQNAAGPQALDQWRGG